jgi:hypothetical protein
MRRLRTLLGITFAALLLSGCTLVPTSSSPELVTRHRIPFGLLSSSIPGTNNGHVHFITQPIYIVDATGHLAASSRIVPSPPVLATVLRQLILGPTQIESFAGYTSALPKSLILLSASIKAGLGYIDLATPTSELNRTQEILAIGQLVLTSRDVGASKGIEITVGGRVQRSLLPNGKRSPIVSPSDYQSLLNS